MSRSNQVSTIDPLALAREQIVSNLKIKRVKKMLGGVEVEVQTRDLRSILSFEADDESPEARVKALANAVFLPEGDRPLFDYENPEHVKMLLGLEHSGDLEDVYSVLTGGGSDGKDVEGN